MPKFDCNCTKDYAHEFNRMCESIDWLSCKTACAECPLYGLDCNAVQEITPEHIKRVQKWSDEHQYQSNKDVICKLFPSFHGNFFCTKAFVGDVSCLKASGKAYSSCVDCREHFLDAPYIERK